MNATESSAEPGGAPLIDSGLASLVMLARFHQVAVSAEQLTHEFAAGGTFQISELLLAAKKLGLKAKVTKVSLDRLDRTPLPAIAQDQSGYFFIIARLDQGKALIHDPKIITMEALAERWTGQLILVGSANGAPDETSRFDFTWFIPAVVKYRKLRGRFLMRKEFFRLIVLNGFPCSIAGAI